MLFRSAQQLSLLKIKAARKTNMCNIFSINNSLTDQLLHSLEFQLTKAQSRCIEEINQDISSPQPMLRLLQGDVGSGKTIVAVFALLQAVSNNFQTAVMAPTEILARQHLQSFSNYLNHLGIKVAFLSGSQNTEERTSQVSLIESGEAQVVIGTHALFQENVSFQDRKSVV